MIIKKIILIMSIFILSFVIIGCSKENIMQDGYYTAEMSEFDFGWKEFVTITVKDNKIASVEYNAKNASGFIKSWDNTYMRNMNSVCGTYPNKYTREYAAQLLEKQGKEPIDAISGATESWDNFKPLSEAVIEQAKKGDSSVALVKTKIKQK